MNRKDRRRQAKVRSETDYEGLHARLLEHHTHVRLTPARAIYDRILADENPHALELFGNTALRYQEFERAASLLQKATRLGTPGASAFNALGLAQLNTEQFQQAATSFASALELDDADFRVWINLGILEREQGQLEAAANAFHRAIQIDPNLLNAHLHLAETRLRSKAPEQARESIETALTLSRGSTWGLALQTVALCELGETARFRELVAYDQLVQFVDAEAPEGFDELDDFHRSLARHIQRHPTLQREPAGFSTRAGSQTLGNLLADPDPVVRRLEAIVDAAVETVLDALPVSPAHPQRARQPNRFRLEGWGVRLTRGGHQTQHIHRDGWWSAVYYIDLGDVVDPGETHAGWLELGRGPDALYPCGSVPETLLVRPQSGRFVIFPSYLWHRTIPFERDGTRVSFAFDVIPA